MASSLALAHPLLTDSLASGDTARHLEQVAVEDRGLSIHPLAAGEPS